jgi:hypothetical protein
MEKKQLIVFLHKCLSTSFLKLSQIFVSKVDNFTTAIVKIQNDLSLRRNFRNIFRETHETFSNEVIQRSIKKTLFETGLHQVEKVNCCADLKYIHTFSSFFKYLCT